MEVHNERLPVSTQPLVWQRSQLTVVRKIDDGGEGTVFEVVGPNSQTMAFKEYNAKALTSHGAATEKKLLAMVAHPPKDPSSSPDHQTFLWPKAVIRDGRTLSGFCMPLLVGTWRKPIHIVDSRARRDSGVANWHWGARATICFNLARAVAALNAAGVAWGDINEENAVVSSKGLVTLLDLDTAAFLAPNGVHHPGSGFIRLDWCPPEYSSDNGYTVEGDRWALAVQIYILLMEGQRPYAAAGFALEPAEHIALGLFPVVDPHVKPPVSSPPLDVLPPDLRMLFRRCFGVGRTSPHLRPELGEFADVLAGLLGRLRTCQKNSAHVWARPRDTCPWCERLAAAQRAATTTTRVAAPNAASRRPGAVPGRAPATGARPPARRPRQRTTATSPRPPSSPTSTTRPNSAQPFKPAPTPSTQTRPAGGASSSTQTRPSGGAASSTQTRRAGGAAKVWLALVAIIGAIVIGVNVFAGDGVSSPDFEDACASIQLNVAGQEWAAGVGVGVSDGRCSRLDIYNGPQQVAALQVPAEEAGQLLSHAGADLQHSFIAVHDTLTVTGVSLGSPSQPWSRGFDSRSFFFQDGEIIGVAVNVGARPVIGLNGITGAELWTAGCDAGYEMSGASDSPESFGVNKPGVVIVCEGYGEGRWNDNRAFFVGGDGKLVRVPYGYWP